MKDLTSGRAVILVLAVYAIACWVAWETSPVRSKSPVELVKPAFEVDQEQLTRLAWQMIGPEGRRAFALGLGCIVAGETVPAFWLGFIEGANWAAMSRPTSGCR